MTTPFPFQGATALEPCLNSGRVYYLYDLEKDVNVLLDGEKRPTNVPACQAYTSAGTDLASRVMVCSKTGVQKEGDVPDNMESPGLQVGTSLLLAATSYVTEVKKEGDRPDAEFEQFGSAQSTSTLLSKSSMRTYAGQEGDVPDPWPFPR